MQTGEELTTAIQASLRKAPYWNFVQDEVKHRLNLIIGGFPILGPLFRDAFLASFKYEHARRMAEGENIPAVVPGVLFGEEMSEECYQSGIAPTKSLLSLNDWIQPNEADVQACISICHHVERLKTLLDDHSINDLLLEPEDT